MNKRYLRFRLSRFPAEVPLLPSIEYDFGGLDDFPMRQGFTSKDLKDLDGCSANDAASFVQSWLFFGLLADLTGDFVDRQSILPLSTPQHELDLRTLWHLAKCRPPELRVRMAYGSDKSSSKTLARRISKIVRIGIQNVERIDRLDVAEKHPMPLILLSVKILLCDLAATEIERSGTYSVPWDHEVEDPRLLPCASGPHIMSSSTRALHGQMIARGWCPSQIQRIGSTCDYSMMYHLSTICRGNDGKNTHQICSSTSCQAYNSDPELYVTSHTTPGCQCSFISAPTEQIDEIINSGGVPLVSIHEVSHGKLAIYVHRSKANSNYTAISHVWSGGLGNVQANSLPICQLEYLNSCLSRLPKDGERGLNYKKNKYIRDLSGSVWISPLGLDNLVSSENRKPRLFWIDTLCIPVDPKSSNLRLRAINKMDAIYAQAGEVLVLDSEIQRLSIGNTHPCELLAHLAYSSWMTRSWTLQEGAIGRAAYFQCADGALTLERPRSYFAEQSALSLVILAFRAVVSIVRHRAVKVNYSERTTGPGMGHERTEDFLLNLLLDSLHRGRNVSMMGDIGTTGLVPDDMRLDSFVSIWNDLSQRSTTKPEDMFAIFANLLDFNAGQITRVPRDERMKAILWSSDSIPFSLLYNTGPRLKDGKNIRDKWVPTVPKGSRLANSPSMKWAVDGRSLCLTTQDDETPPLAVTAQVDSLPLYCYLIDDGSDQMYFIKAVRSDIDAVSTVNHEAICVIIESSSSGTARGSNLDYASKLHGACFFVVSSKQSATLTSPSPERSQVQHSETLENHRLSLTTVYDCPVRVWAVEDVESVPESEKGAVESLDGPVCCPIVRCRGFTTDYELHLETGIDEIRTRH